MSEPETIHWHDGLFLLHHHLQFQQQGMLDRLAGERLRSRPFPWGLIALEIDEDALRRQVVAVKRCEAVMPRGTLVAFPGNAQLATRDLRSAFREDRRPITISLAIPERNLAGPSVAEGEGGGAKRTWRVAERTWLDECEGGRSEPLLVRLLDARLVTDREETADLELLPLMRLRPSAEDSAEVLPRLDDEWAPPCRVLAAHPGLASVLEQLTQQLGTRSGELASEIERVGYGAESLSGSLVELVLRARSVGAAAGRLDALRQDPTYGPFDLYLELRGVLGELAALSPGRDWSAPAYRHDEALPVLRELARRVANLAAAATSGTYDKLPLRAIEPGRVWEAALGDDLLAHAEEWYLAAHAPGAGAEVARLVGDPDRFKLVPASLREARVRGVRLQEERKPPPVLPALPDTVWFRLAREENARAWTQVRDERRLLAVCPQAVPGGLSLTLFATRRAGGRSAP